MAILLSGKELAAAMKGDAKQRTTELKKTNVTPSLALILIGNDEGSKRYVELKAKQCMDVGAIANIYDLEQNTTPEELAKKIQVLNQDDTVHGILVQLPVPEILREIIDTIDVKKDVDGLTSFSLGRIMQGREGYAPAGAEAVIELLISNNIQIKNKRVVVIGASNILGKPLCSLFTNRGSIATLIPSHHSTIAQYTKNADIIVVDTARPKTLTADMISSKAIVIDAGNNYVDGKLVGDVDFKNVKEVAKAVTPVPGGVGPMLVAVLIRNLLRAAEK